MPLAADSGQPRIVLGSTVFWHSHSKSSGEGSAGVFGSTVYRAIKATVLVQGGLTRWKKPPAPHQTVHATSSHVSPRYLLVHGPQLATAMARYATSSSCLVTGLGDMIDITPPES